MINKVSKCGQSNKIWGTQLFVGYSAILKGSVFFHLLLAKYYVTCQSISFLCNALHILGDYIV